MPMIQNKLQVGISVGGVYTSTDGGASWVQDNAQVGGKEDRPTSSAASTSSSPTPR